MIGLFSGGIMQRDARSTRPLHTNTILGGEREGTEHQLFLFPYTHRHAHTHANEDRMHTNALLDRSLQTLIVAKDFGVLR